jgi:hypothetical protein
MIIGWFQSKYPRDKDKSEIVGIREKYGDDAKSVIRDRMNISVLSKRDREHWKRIARKL